ncbi:MAG: biosynthetic arginine decarboxylase [Ignavibacteria bacterium]|jgi:arginine decarboxylase|nr:biosynthetic arginine decarboxylase [Ignavibacteria bacterium]
MRKWNSEDSAELYNICGWGVGYFGINAKGNVIVTPHKDGHGVELLEIIDELQIKDVSMPVLLRFPDIIDNRIETISRCFDAASKEYEYNGKNFIIYPIKVNQMRQVVEEIVDHGKKFNIGLEAGSKPELHAVLGVSTENSLIVCNGYKDNDYIELALLAQKMGKRIYIVVEKTNELKKIIKISKDLKIKPNIGIRIKLASSGSGKWEDSGGDKSKFGLTSSELLEAIDLLDKHKLKENLKLIHFHIGSQVTNIRKIKTAFREASNFYVQLHKLGCNIEYVDIGGGLGVDYEGTRSANSSSSTNYSIQEYVNDAIANFVDAANHNDLPHPNIVTESGRSLAAHHSVLVFDVLEANSLSKMDDSFELKDEHHELVKELYEIWDNISINRILEAWHDAQQIREESLERFSLGVLDLETRALVEKIFWSIADEVSKLTLNIKHPAEEFKQIEKLLTDKYFCNFSLFQSLPDSWAIDQLFPIMPIHRLNEKPDKFATLQDITCDSDGKVNQFISTSNSPNSLPIHSLGADPYYIGVFLVGAYQEILGDLHNLFGDTNAVHINVNENGYNIEQVIDGETVAEVLEYVQYKPKKLVRDVETYVANSIKAGKITAQEGKEFLSIYRSGLFGYTYLE